LIMPLTRCFREDVVELEQEYWPDPWSKRDCSDFFKIGGKCLIATHKGMVVGHMFYRYEQRDMSCLVNRLYVMEEFRREGIGTALLQRLQRRYKKPWRSIDVTVWEGDLQLQLFLRSYGFHCFGISDGWYDDAPDDQVYWFGLSGQTTGAVA